MRLAHVSLFLALLAALLVGHADALATYTAPNVEARLLLRYDRKPVPAQTCTAILRLAPGGTTGRHDLSTHGKPLNPLERETVAGALRICHPQLYDSDAALDLEPRARRRVLPRRPYDRDAESYFARASTDKSRTGCFLQRDPNGYGDSVNLYAFAANDPVNGRDPTGAYFDRNGNESVGPANPDPEAREYETREQQVPAEIMIRAGARMAPALKKRDAFEALLKEQTQRDRTGLEAPLIDPIDLSSGLFTGLAKGLASKMVAGEISSELSESATSPIKSIATAVGEETGAEASRPRYPNFTYGSLPKGVLGETDKFGNITIQRGLSGQLLDETLRHEGVHSVLSPTAGGAIQTARADLGMWAYRNSNLVRYLEEAAAETYGSRSLTKGLLFPLNGAYNINPLRLGAEAAIYGGIVVGPAAVTGSSAGGQ